MTAAGCGKKRKCRKQGRSTVVPNARYDIVFATMGRRETAGFQVAAKLRLWG